MDEKEKTIANLETFIHSDSSIKRSAVIKHSLTAATLSLPAVICLSDGSNLVGPILTILAAYAHTSTYFGMNRKKITSKIFKTLIDYYKTVTDFNEKSTSLINVLERGYHA